MQELDDITNYLKLQSTQVQRNSTIVSNDEAGSMLHIDVKTPRFFIPMMPRRAAISEDNTMARVTVSDSLIGCMVGYSNLPYDFHSGIVGMDINLIPYNYCLRINTKLVYDADATNEHWLVGYNRQNLRYTPVTIGQIHITKLSHRRVQRDMSKNRVVVTDTVDSVIAITSNDVIRFDSTRTLRKGYYKSTINLTHLENITLYRISESEYHRLLELSVVTLDHDSKPLYSNW